jgi:integrase
MDAVTRWMNRRREFGFRNGPLFCTMDGRPVSDRYVRDMLKRQAAKAGLEKRVHPHGLRHTHAAELVREGVPVNVIRDQLGHASLASLTAITATLRPPTSSRWARAASGRRTAGRDTDPARHHVWRRQCGHHVWAGARALTEGGSASPAALPG